MNAGVHRWTRLALVAVAIPLMGPTCAGGGLHDFSANSIIIPMDECYQTDSLASRQSYCVAPNTSADDGVLKAYGLVYFLIKHGITVYWVIDPSKTSVSAVDLTLVATGEPTLKYSWASNSFGSFLGGATTAQYRGGPFVVDGADAAKVQTLLTTDPDFAQFLTAEAVDLHQSTTAFSAPVAKTLAGLPPALALVDITGGDGTNAEPVLEAYLSVAGLDFTGAGGDAAPYPDAGAAIHGAIYDRLLADDLIPGSTGASVFSSHGYSLVWIPHWEGPKSKLRDGGTFESDGGTLIPILQTIGSFVDDGGDLFVECAGIGTVEGAFAATTGVVNASYGPGLVGSRSDTDAGVIINSTGSPLAAPYTFGEPASPFSQIGDFPFSALTGAINDFGPLQTTGYLPEVEQLITESDAYSLFTVVPHRHQSTAAGTVVYLAGHNYSTQTAGTRLVLNTLFNLSGACASPNTPCNTGLLGVCAAGILQCTASGAGLVCNPLPDAGASAEICDGLDNNCDGLVDNLPPQACYDGPAGTDQYPPCHDGSQTCVNGVWGPCSGEGLPQPVACDGIDDACNGLIDLLPDGGSLTQACYDGPLGTEGVGICHGGTQTCDPATSMYGPCVGEQLPQPPVCSQSADNDCNGVPDTGACVCQDGQTQACYDGPSGTLNVGICHAGQETCSNNQWGPCIGEQLPEPMMCDGTGTDYACSGVPGEGCALCTEGATQLCWTGPDGGIFPDGGGVGVCHGGLETCTNDAWGPCQGEVLPGPELCDGKDNDCDGVVDGNAICPMGDTCINGVCAPTSCSNELATCGEGFTCTNGMCALTTCGTSGVPCPSGQRCANGLCVDPCQGVTCGAGSFCSAGSCVAGGCYDTPCTAGLVCVAGQCVTDPCASLVCPTNDFCQNGFCVASCVFVDCPAGQVCGGQGQCAPLPCNGACSAQSCLADGGCGRDVCTGVGCASLQTCVDQAGSPVCVTDPCAGVTCPAGFCVDGQCQRQSGASSSESSTGSTGGAGSSGHASSSSGQGSTPAATLGAAGTAGAGSGSAGTSGGQTTARGSGAIRANSGCGCTTGGDSFPGWALGVLLVAWRRRRASPWLAVAATLAACSPTASPPGSSSTSTSGGSGASGSAGVTASSGSSGSTSSSRGSSTGSSSSGRGSSSGASCPSGQAFCFGACVDVLGSVEHCGSCNNSCDVGDVCDVGFCGSGTSVNPTITAVQPAGANVGASVDVTVTGALFQTGAQVVLNGGGAADQIFSATFTDAQHLVGHLDLHGLQAGAATLSVLDPGQLLSNSVTFTLAGGTDAPTLSSVTPASGDPGTTIALVVAGMLFDSSTTLHVTGLGVPDLALTTTEVSSTELDASLSTTGFTAGTYSLYAVSSGSARSNTLDFTVNSVVPTLSSITPTSATVGSPLTLDADGTGFDSSTALHLQSVSGAQPVIDDAFVTEFVLSTQVQVPAANPLSLANLTPGAYQIVAENAAGTLISNAEPFTISSARPTLSTISPTSATLGQTLELEATGSAFDTTSVIHVLQGSADTSLATQLTDAGLTATFTLLGVPAGSVEVAVINSGDLASNVLVFTVLSNQALLQGLAPSGGQAGTTVTLLLTGSNFEAGASVVVLSGPGIPDGGTPLPTALEDAGLAEVVDLDLTPYLTGSYAIEVVNPGAAPSAPLPFSVQPGLPVLASISPSSAATNTLQTFALSGALFATGAYVEVTGANGLDVSFPTTQVSPSSLTVPNVNLSNVPAGTYSVTVVNPGPQASGTASLTVTP